MTKETQHIETDLLNRILADKLRLVDGQHVEYYHRQRKRWYRKKPDQHPLSGRHRFRFGPRRETVYRNRLVWMIANKEPIPDGHVVEHSDGNRLNDALNNLELMTIGDSNSQGNSKQAYDRSREVLRFFDFITLYGCEPTDDDLVGDSNFF